MASILFWTSIYFIIVIHTVLFFGCSSYGEKPCVVAYNNEITSFYDEFVVKMESHGNKISRMFFSDTVIGSLYRHSLVKDYLKNDDKLRELEFTESEIKSINDLIVPGFEERIVLFDMLRAIFVFATIILGVVVGSLI